VYLRYFHDSEASQRKQQFRITCAGFAASLAGVPALPVAAPQAAFQVTSSEALLLPQDASPRFLVRGQLGPYFASMVDRSPALPLLAVRAARRALATNPESASAWLRLGQAYLLLRNTTCEHSAEGLLPPLSQLRMVQILTALEQAVRLDPNLEAAHSELARLYGERQYLDQSLEHYRQVARLAHQTGRRAGGSTEEAAVQLEVLDKDLAKLEEQVQDLRKKYAANSPSLQGDRRAQAEMALKMGLPRLAAEEILLPTDANVLGAPGIRLELDLLLSLGRADEVRTILNEKGLRASRHALRYYDMMPPRSADGGSLYPLPYHWPTYEWLHVMEAAALGDYAQARTGLAAIRSEVQAGHDRLRQQPLDMQQEILGLAPGLFTGSPRFLTAFTVLNIRRLVEQKALLDASEATLRAQQADVLVLEALLALEQGDPEAARSAFLETQELCGPAAGTEVPFGGRPIAAGYLSKLRAKE
jgi:tetratricopeptide (TPR) repeat protein